MFKMLMYSNGSPDLMSLLPNFVRKRELIGPPAIVQADRFENQSNYDMYKKGMKGSMIE